MRDFIINVEGLGKGVTQRGFNSVLIVSNELDMDIKAIDDVVEDGVITNQLIKGLKAQGNDLEMYLIGKEGATADEVVELIKSAKEEKGFYFVLTTLEDAQDINTVAEYIGGEELFYFAPVSDVEFEGVEYANVAYVAHKDGERLDAGITGVMVDGIGKTAKFKTIKGATVSGFDLDEMKTLQEKNINFYTERLGIKYFTEGVSSDGSFIDDQLVKQYLIFRLEEDLLQHFTSVDNVDYTNAGIAEMVDVVDKRLRFASSDDVAMLDTYEITYKKKEELPATELAGRRYDYIYVDATTRGAIHGGKINIYFVL